jgi:hypothetical protein
LVRSWIVSVSADAKMRLFECFRLNPPLTLLGGKGPLDGEDRVDMIGEWR